MDFLERANGGVLYLIAGAVILVVVAMSVFFMLKAWREGVRIGMDRAKMRKAVTASATFTLIPSVGILIGVIALAGSLGVPVPWLRLSVIGALHYETMAADVAAKASGLTALSAEQMTGDAFVAIVTVMTVGIIWGGLFCIFGLKKYQRKVLVKADGRWGPILFNAMFVGMVCAFIGSGFADLRRGSFISLIVIAVAALCMAFFEWLIRSRNQKWLESFALSFSMVLGMTAAVLATLAGVN